MLILLPPSETKRLGGVGTLDSDSLSFTGHLSKAREAVRLALVELCRGDHEAAAKALKLGVKNRGELEHNLELESSGVMPAIDRYTGVLYDALGAAGLDPRARSWVDDHVCVQSALFGLVSAGSKIPAYRLSASTRLPSLGAPLKRVWSAAHAEIDWSDAGFVLDLRSKDYAALAPLPEGASWLLHVAQRDVDGEVRALNHFNKAAKGDLVQRLARSLSGPNAGDIIDVASFANWAAGEGLEVTVDAAARTVTLVTNLTAPSLASRPRVAAR